MIERRDALDVSLHDNDLQEEVELTTQLIIASSCSEEPLSQDEVDALLGLSAAP